MVVLKKTNWKVPGDLKALDQILSSLDQIYQPWIVKKDWLQCQLALTEGFTNAVRHAHKNLPAKVPIEIELTLRRQSLEIQIWDRGSPFDLQAYIKTLDRQGNNRSVGGQGIPILHKIADRLSYVRTDDHRNCLLIVKQFSSVEQNVNE